MEENTTAAERRKDAYEHCIMIVFPEGGDELITFDDAAKMFNSYSAVGDVHTAEYLRSELVRVKAEIKRMFPDENE